MCINEICHAIVRRERKEKIRSVNSCHNDWRLISASIKNPSTKQLYGVPFNTKEKVSHTRYYMASVSSGHSRRGSSTKMSVASTSSRSRISQQDSRRGFQEIQDGLDPMPTHKNAILMPRTFAERTAREEQRIHDHEERKKWRQSRLKSITNQWADNRLENSSLDQPRRASWMRIDEVDDIDDKKCNYLCCGCFG